jgi:hypothetical protein
LWSVIFPGMKMRCFITVSFVHGLTKGSSITFQPCGAGSM